MKAENPYINSATEDKHGVGALEDSITSEIRGQIAMEAKRMQNITIYCVAYVFAM